MDTRKKALCKALKLNREQIREVEQGYDDETYETSEGEYLVLSEAEADERVKAYIRESLWAFNPEFLAAYMPDGVDADVLRILQEKCEGANEALFNMVTDFDAVVDDAVGCDGRGHFLAHYDFEEHEAQINGEWFYAYRVN